MKILHTSDWHIGHTLYGQKRYEEFKLFFEWLINLIKEEKIEVLIVSGDIFDTTLPCTLSQKLYYEFLCNLLKTDCFNTVIIGGNHDSPSFLNAPKTLLSSLNIYVICTIGDEVLLLKNKKNEPTAIICAVPYLRDRDIRTAEAGETIEEKNKKIENGIRNHYEDVLNKAEKLRKILNTEIPIIATGHLFTAGGKTTDGDGIRELYIGSLLHLKKALFPPSIDYFALGHLHIPQTVNGDESMRYSGSPIPLSFNEGKWSKSVVIAEFKGGIKPSEIREVPVPVFQKLKKIKGNSDELTAEITKLIKEESNIWLEVEYTGELPAREVRESLSRLTENSQIQILKITTKATHFSGSILQEPIISLSDLNEEEVFLKLLEKKNISEEEKSEQFALFKEIKTAILESDPITKDSE